MGTSYGEPLVRFSSISIISTNRGEWPEIGLPCPVSESRSRIMKRKAFTLIELLLSLIHI